MKEFYPTRIKMLTIKNICKNQFKIQIKKF